MTAKPANRTVALAENTKKVFTSAKKQMMDKLELHPHVPLDSTISEDSKLIPSIEEIEKSKVKTTGISFIDNLNNYRIY